MSGETVEDDRTRFEVVEDACFGNHYEGDRTSSSIYSKARKQVDKIFTHTFSPGGVTGKARPVYEVYLVPGVEEVVPAEVASAAAFFNLDVTAVETRYVDEATEQVVLLLEPSDTEAYPRD